MLTEDEGLAIWNELIASDIDAALAKARWIRSGEIPPVEPWEGPPLITQETTLESRITGIGGVLTWSFSDRRFRHFATHIDMCRYVMSRAPAQRTFCERIYGNQRQKLRLDIDSKECNLNFDDLEAVLECIIAVMSKMFGQAAAREKIYFCDSTRAGKQSFHVIVDGFFVAETAISREFARQVIERLGGRAVAGCIDTTIYSAAASLRCAYCHKGAQTPDWTSGVKKLPPGIGILNSLVTYVDDCVELFPGVVPVNAPAREVLRGEIAPYVAIMLEKFPDHSYRDYRGGSINFNRVRAGTCHLSGREHTHDNTLFAVFSKLGLYARCRHCKGATRVCNMLAGDEAVQAPEAVPAKGRPKKIPIDVQREREARVLSLCSREYPPRKWRSADVLEYTGAMNQHSDYMEEYPDDVPTIHVRAAMGCGKTEALRRLISRTQPKSVLVISHRVSFTIDICAKLKYVSYQDITGTITPKDAPYVVVQCESLFRVEQERYELIVCDEIESIMSQMFAPTHRRGHACWITFERLLLYCDQLITMDGNLTQETVDIIGQIRDVRTVIVDNRAIPRKTMHKVTTNKSAMVAILLTLVGRGERVVVPTSSLSMAKKLEKMIRERYPDRRLMMYSSETPVEVREETLRDVNKSWVNYDVLIFTPTISAGPSFTEPHFNALIGFWYDTSCDVFTMMQMTWRARNIMGGTYYHYVSESGRGLPDTVEAVREHVSRSLDHACEYMTDPVVTMADGGRVVHQDTTRFNAWLYLTARRNYSQNHFLAMMIRELKGVGGTVAPLITSFEGNAENEVKVRRVMRGIGEGIKREEAEAVAAARELTAEEIEGIAAGRVVEKAALQKYYLRKCYDYRGEVTREIVEKYGDATVKMQYHARRNLREVHDEVFGNPGEALQILGRRFAAVMMENLESADGREVDSLRKLFDFNRDSICVRMLGVFGLRLGDARELPREEVLAALSPEGEGYKWMRANCRFICETFDVKVVALPAADDANFFKNMLDFINGKLKSRYGVGIKLTSKHSGLYRLEDALAKLFTDDFKIPEGKN